MLGRSHGKTRHGKKHDRYRETSYQDRSVTQKTDSIHTPLGRYAVVHRHLTQQAIVAAYQDCYILVMLLCLASLSMLLLRKLNGRLRGSRFSALTMGQKCFLQVDEHSHLERSLLHPQLRGCRRR